MALICANCLAACYLLCITGVQTPDGDPRRVCSQQKGLLSSFWDHISRACFVPELVAVIVISATLTTPRLLSRLPSPECTFYLSGLHVLLRGLVALGDVYVLWLA